jgi:hypothetical protein
VNFLEPLGFKLYGLGMSEIWIFYHSGKVIFKASQTLSGKIIVSDSSDKIVISSRNSEEIKEYLTPELRDFKIDKLL